MGYPGRVQTVVRQQHLKRAATGLDLWDCRGAAFLYGESAAFSLALAWQVHLLEAGHPVFSVDGANRFDVFTLVDECLRRGLAVDPVLDALCVQRAFTPYQILDAATRIYKEGDPRTLYFFLAPCKQFFDGDVNEEEGEYLLGRLLGVFAKIKQAGLNFVIADRHYTAPAFRGALQGMYELADQHFAITKDDTYGQNPPTLFHADRRDRGAPAQLPPVAAQ